MSQKNIIIALIGLLAILIIVFGIIVYSLSGKIKILEKEAATPAPQFIEPTDYGAGTIGEMDEGGVDLPPALFNTTGTIKEIQKDRLIADGNGSNFADQQPRELTLIFTTETITFEPGQKVFYQGAEGLKYLKPGMNISINGAENIRGKTEFQINTINLIQ